MTTTDTPTTIDQAAAVRDLLVGRRYFWQTEYDLQDSIGEVLERAGHDVHRERHLGAAGRIDFYLGPTLMTLDRDQVGLGSIGVEVKVKGALAPLVRQLRSYAAHPDIAALVVATTRAVHRGVPKQILGKPVLVAPLIGDLL